MTAVRATQAEITRVIKAWTGCGFELGAVEVGPDGTIRVLAKSEKPTQSSKINDWFNENDKNKP